MLTLVDNDATYWEFVRDLKNTDQARHNSVSTHIISREEHHKYMEIYGDRYYICVENDVPIGYVGTNAQDYVSIAVVSGHRGKGVGKYMLQSFRDKVKLHHLRAIVSITNEPSLRLFEACGFVKKYYIFEGE